MDRITAGFLEEFSESHNLKMLPISTQFEHFANYCSLSNEVGTVDFDILDMHTGDSAQGIDGIAIIVNGGLVDSISDISDLIKQNKKIDVTFVFVQAKTEDSFDNKLIGNFLAFASIFFSDDAKATFSSEEMQRFIEIKDFIYFNAKFMKSYNPRLELYYVTTGHWNNNDKSLNAVIKKHKLDLEQSLLFSSVNFTPCGSQELQQFYRKSQENLEATFIFSKKIVMFSGSNGDVGYSGVLPFEEFFKILCEPNGSLKNVFEDNIRDFLGENNDVNSDIENTIQSTNSNIFCMLNNGITVVANSGISTGDTMTITNYQIVNGCQTSHVLYMNRSLVNINNLLIPIKIIVTQNEELKNSITKATNNQTGITKEQLEALSSYQKTLEEYYKTYSDESGHLFYERRLGQYRNTSTPKSRIISIRSQIKNMAAMFNDNPHSSAGHYGSLIKDIGTKIFKSDDKPAIYYTSSLALSKFEDLIKAKIINKAYRKAKYHAIMLIKYVILEKTPKYHNSKAIDTACQKIIKILNDPDQCENAFLRVIEYIESQSEIDLSDRKVFERKETTDLLLKRISQMIPSVA